MKKTAIIIGIFLFLCNYSTVFSQFKTEREYRIKQEMVPQKALAFAEDCHFAKKVKWYAEESHEGKTIEAKTIHRNYKYSIEFDTAGNILDVEKTVPFESLESALKKNIQNSFDTVFSKYKIVKTQIQWQGEETTLIEIISTGETSNIYILMYEIVVKGRIENSQNFYEALLDEQGKIVKILKIKPGNAANLEF
jgi:hypothetical protein